MRTVDRTSDASRIRFINRFTRGNQPVVVTDAVERRTVLLLLRFRYLLKETVEEFAEEVVPAARSWLPVSYTARAWPSRVVDYPIWQGHCQVEIGLVVSQNAADLSAGAAGR